MTEKELKKLSRAELLELLLVQTKEAERLRKKLERAEEQLSDRHLKVQEAGNLAQAVLAVNGVMEAAQEAAQQYLDNILQMENETKLRCEKLLADAEKEAQRIRSSAPAAKKEDPEGTLVAEIYQLLDN